MKKKNSAKKSLLWLMITAIVVGNSTPAVAAVNESRDVITEASKEKAESQAERKASASDAASITPGPERSTGFEDGKRINGKVANETNGEISLLKKASASDAKAVKKEFSTATGDLWDQWIGATMSFDGTGSKKDPYKITNLSELMGLSEAVAQGESYSGKHFELQTDLDLQDLNLNNGDWNPIGWFKNKADLSGKPKTAFEGIFDGAGNTISGLKFTKMDHRYSYLGLFGYLKNGEIKNLTIEADEISGNDNVSLLVGCIEGNSKIYNVTVNGVVYGTGDTGSIAGEVTGGTKQAVIENCTADNVVLNSEGIQAFIGGIVGNAQKTDIVDCKVSTLDGDSNRIQGKGYVGGIAGRQNKVNIYNSYVTGTIGGNLTKAVGGITGIYESGNIICAQMDGEISRTNNGIASHEGAIIGYREARNGFRYGTGRSDNLSYLFVSEDQKALVKNISGSGIADDNIFTKAAHIGYYTDFQKKYTLVAGRTETGSGDRYYYEELEDAVKYIITQKLGKALDLNYAKDEEFKIDHYAPGNQGEPVLGYLVSIPRIDAKNANGTVDNDVATLTAMPSTNSSYYRQIDKGHPFAVTPGVTISVATAAKNKGRNRYQMVFDANAEGKVKPPTYTDESGIGQKMTYVNGGSYSFIMPESDTELNVEYAKVTTALTITPAETDIHVTQTRSGDRKNPQITTEVRDSEGTLIARYINGNRDHSVQALPISIHAEHNGEGASADNSVLWSIDDTNLLHFEDGWTGNYTTDDAKIIPNIQSDFIQNTINREVKAQADGGYKQSINNTIYTDSGVVTAATRPSIGTDYKAVVGTCKVNVNFQIKDQTTIRVEGLVLNQANLSFEVLRKLTGNRDNPKEEYVVTEPIHLDARLNPSQPFYKNVTWKDLEGGKIISLTPSGDNQQSCSVAVICDMNGKNNPAWIQNIINGDNSRKTTDGGYLKLTGSGTQTETVTVTSEDQTHGIVTATCNVTINFRTEDKTVIRPEQINLSKKALSYDLLYRYEGDTKSKIKEKQGFGRRDTLSATVFPDIEKNGGHEPYNRDVIWSSSDPNAVVVENGTLIVKDDAEWIKNAVKQAPYAAEKTVTVIARTKDGDKQDSCTLTLRFKATTIETDRDGEVFHVVLTKTGRRSNPEFSWTGDDAKKFHAALYHADRGVGIKWTSDHALLTVSDDGTVQPVVTDADGNVTANWISEALKKHLSNAEISTTVTATSTDGSMRDTVPVRLTFSVVDNTHISGGSGGSGGGGGGSSSGGFRASGDSRSGFPGYVRNGGTWSQNASGRWFYSDVNGSMLTDTWAAIKNPYADTTKGQAAFTWFHFEKDSSMTTGWYTDSDGNIYYLHAISDNTLGHMYTGWHWIDDNGDGTAECYYFNPVSDGFMGKLYRSGVTPDGYLVNEKGQWIKDGLVQRKQL